MRFTTPAVLIAAGMLLQACSAMDRDGDEGMSGPGRHKPVHAPVQTLQPVHIDKLNPSGTPSARFSMAICETSTCDMTVTVDPQCNVTLDPQYVGLRYANPSMDFTLVFTLSNAPGASYQFNAQPIHWKKQGGGATQVVLKSPTRLEVTFKNANQAGRFVYGIVIADSNGVPCRELDPGVIPDL